METVGVKRPETVPAPADFNRPEKATGGQLYGPGGWQSANGATATPVRTDPNPTPNPTSTK